MPNPSANEPKKRVSLVKRDWIYTRLVLMSECDELQTEAYRSRAKYVAEETEENRLKWAEDQGRWNRMKRIIEEIGKAI